MGKAKQTTIKDIRRKAAIEAAIQGVIDEVSILSHAEVQGLLVNAAIWAKEEWNHKQNKHGLYIMNQNDKLSKEGNGEYLAFGIEFASAKRAGIVVCQTAVLLGLQCTRDCIFQSGNGRFKNVKECRKRKTQMFFENPTLFMSLLIHDIEVARLQATLQGKKLCVRPNVFSDLPWHKIAPWLFAHYSDVIFYGYSKEEYNLNEELPANYHITMSYHEKMSWDTVESFLNKGINVAVVFNRKKDKMPPSYKGFPVINGDAHDFRFLDPKGVIVGLARKGKLSQENNKGFMIEL